MQRFFGPRNQRGLTMVETVVAVALLSVIGVAFLSAMTTSTNATGLVEKKVDIDQLARSQLEYIKGLDYLPVWDPSGPVPEPANYYKKTPADIYQDIETAGQITLPADYTIVVSDPVSVDDTGGSPNPDIQKITVTIMKDGNNLLVVEGYKVNR